MFCVRLTFVLTGSDENSPLEHPRKGIANLAVSFVFSPQLEDRLSDELIHFLCKFKVKTEMH